MAESTDQNPDPEWEQNLSQSRIDVLECSICTASTLNYQLLTSVILHLTHVKSALNCCFARRNGMKSRSAAAYRASKKFFGTVYDARTPRPGSRVTRADFSLPPVGATGWSA